MNRHELLPRKRKYNSVMRPKNISTSSLFAKLETQLHKAYMSEMDPLCLLPESEFWKQTIEEYGLEDKIEAIVRDPCISWDEIARIPSTDSDITKPTVLLGGTIRLDVSRAVFDCENFMSQVFRLQAIADGITHHCFVKVLPQKPALREMARKYELYQREIIMFSDVFPYLRNLLTQIGLNPADYLMVPNLYHANLGLNDNGLPTSKTILATEDLRFRGFRMVNKKQGCDLNHAKCALRSLAYFHALSNTMLRKTMNHRENLKYLDVFTKPDAPENSPTALALYKSCIRSVGEAVEQLGYPVIAKKLAIFGDNAEQHNAREMEEEAGLLACLIHGDYWSNNMLFQYDEQTGLPIATAMVDWQVAAVGHPARDIGYFFLTSTRNSVWRNHWSELLLVYFEHLRSLLCQLGLDLEASGYTESRFMNEFAGRIRKALPQALLALPILLSEDIGTEIQRNESGKQNFDGEHEENLTDSTTISQEAQNNFSNAITAEKLLANRACRDGYSDLLLELIGREWF